MRQQLAKLQFKKGMDPALIFEQLTSIQNQHLGPGKRLNKDELIALTLDIATDEYKATLTIKRKMKGEKLTVEDLELAMTEEYHQNFRNKASISTSKGEMLLVNQGVCYKCGKPGH
jgi:hypothetical protein